MKKLLGGTDLGNYLKALPDFSTLLAVGRWACTDNDRGGSKGSSYAARWLAAGLDRMERAGGWSRKLEAATIGSFTQNCAQGSAKLWTLVGLWHGHF
eukprot:1160534-Pelagomonas_calceolata.AAC.6